ncbi:hypothetical protein [Marinicella marina]|uniref:hypothetical protein n=1 Tax=Marinicella marina TaxID=2996016 RepID=UPI0024BC52AF|nr:hypothetical protein [Marinicella marina]MDJ1139644.1 hypothetical protein [Marinicella marina]
MAKWISFIPGIFKGIGEYFSRKHELRMKKLDLKYKVEEAKAVAEINYQQTKLEGHINWELEQIRNSGIKDDVTLYVLLIIILSCGIPYMQPYIREGFALLGELPFWFQVIVTIALTAQFGVRTFGSYTKLVQAKQQAQSKMLGN